MSEFNFSRNSKLSLLISDLKSEA